MGTTFEDYSSNNLNDPSKVLFSNTTIDRFSGEGENNFAVAYPCILKRISIATSTGSSSNLFDSASGLFDSMSGNFDSGGGSGSFNNIFTLPDDVLSIRRVTWKGYKLDPLPHRNFREVFQNATQLGRPFWYVFNNIGQNQIQLFPGPNEQLPLGSSTGLFDSTPGLFDSMTGLFDTAGGSIVTNTTSDLYGANIDKCFIVEYFQAPDYTTAIIPTYFRRRLLKSYVLRGCFNIEGQGQNRKASSYFKERWRVLKEMYGNLLFDLHNKPRKLIVSGTTSSYYFPGNPMLPINKFGTSVDAGE